MRRNIDRCTAALLSVMLGLTGCATTGRPVAELTPLQIRSIQTRDYDVKQKKVLIQAVMGQLQDDGYIIKEADADLGFLTARREVDLRAEKSSGSVTPGQVAVGVTVVAALVAGIVILAKNSKGNARHSEPSEPSASVSSGQPSPPADRIRATECTVTVTPNGPQMRLRVNFQEEVRNDNGGVSQAAAIRDEKVYQDFFAKVDKSLFIERETVSVSSVTVTNN